MVSEGTYNWPGKSGGEYAYRIYKLPATMLGKMIAIPISVALLAVPTLGIVGFVLWLVLRKRL